ncbi:MAG: hypothetical protein SCH39_11630 [Methanosarcinales archaeon]|nr:hypothetical protein [ANME-2 cluster archaeon]MDF1531794.1 hypothetical protein [ANME-2 cluster archaeon]MDW7776967.1 hypothetical protein [Methanosarcinales archaeon]
MVVLPASAASPEITSWYNDKTGNEDLNITINTSEIISFNVTVNQSIDIWNWSIDDVEVLNNNYDNFSKSWVNPGTVNVSVNATNNTNGTSSTITWKITVKEPAITYSPGISSWYNNKTNDAHLNVEINTSETIKFSVTANQSIDTWNWSIDGSVLNNNNYNYSTSWSNPGVRNVSVNATNSNGTSNTITWKVTVKEPVIISAPEITSWYNNKTDDADLDIKINVNETVKFTVTANQSIDTWNWSVDGVDKNNNHNYFQISWITPGTRIVSVKAVNSNGSDTISWKVTVKTVTENGIILHWEPEQIVDYIYVNDTITETIKYSITTSVPIVNPKWTVDGIPVTGTVSGTTYSYTHTWDNESFWSSHKIIITGSYDDSQVIFKWYVNVYEIGEYSGGPNIFDIIDDALRNHATDVKIRMEKRKMHDMGDKGNAYLAQKVNLLHDEIDKRQSIRAALRDDYKSGILSKEEYVAGLQQAQVDAKYNKKIVQELEKDLARNAKSKSQYNNGKNNPEGINPFEIETNMTISKNNNGRGNDKGNGKAKNND